MAKQLWKDVKGFEGLYKISNQGQVYSVRNNCILKHSVTNSGYAIITFYFFGETKTFLIHRLVAQAFIPNNNNLPCVNHKDENKLNNNVENLEWCTYSYNYHFGNSPIKARKNHLNNKRMSIPVLCKKDGVLIKEYPSIREAERQTGIKNQNIVLCCQGKIKSSGGYIWQYKQ